MDPGDESIKSSQMKTYAGGTAGFTWTTGIRHDNGKIT